MVMVMVMRRRRRGWEGERARRREEVGVKSQRRTTWWATGTWLDNHKQAVVLATAMSTHINACLIVAMMMK